jgi:TonB-linked SusC/RagA family outer membrane protein
MMKVTRSRFVASLALGAAVAFGGASRVQAQAQAAVINGRVTSDQGRPLQAVNVFITELSVSVGTNEAGNYTITIPAARVSGQTVNMRVRAVGFSPQSRPVTITSGTQTVNWELKADILRLSEVVVTGVSAATEQVKVPFAVAKVDTSQMPVSGTNALSQLQGKVAGVTVVSASGRPGSAPSVVLRGPVSMNAQGRSQQPLYIVDGVLLNGAIPDLNPNDIASFEVVKGAAAASLYGARGGAGVINITTKTGRNAQQGMKFGVRTEAGAGDIERDWPISNQHFLQMSPNGQLFCTTETFGASQCARYVNLQDETKRINDQPADAALPPVNFKGDAGIARAAGYPLLTGLFQANTWPKTHDPVGQVVTPSAFSNTTLDLRGRINLTGVYASVGHLEQQAPVRFLDGFSRSSGRVNVDHSFSDRLSAHINTYYSRSEEGAANQDQGTGGLWFQLTRTPAYVNMVQRDQLGRLYVRSNPLNQGDQNANPLYSALYNTRTDQSTRFIGGTTLRYSPLDFLNFEGNFSYDRATGQFTQQRDRGYRTTSADAATSSGFLSQGSNDNTSLNTSISGTASRTFFTDLVARLNARYLYNQTENTNQNLSGIGLAVPGLVTADAVTQNYSIGSNAQQIKEIGMFTSADLEFKERYILQGAIRRDGSSLFGPQNRWKNFGRVSGAWIASAEPWWFTPNALNLFKLRASYGQSGQRPAFASQYETFTIGAGGTLNPATLGNKELKPEINTELEVGTDIQLFNRIGVNLTYAHARIDDQILPVRPPTATGFAQRWENVGEIENKTWELTLDLPVLERRNLSWTQRIIWDRTRSFVKRLDIAPFTDAVVVGNTYTVFQYRQGERIGTFYGVDFARECGQLPAPFNAQCGGSGSQFQKNDDGYIVWTGGRSQTEGVTSNLWTTQLPGCIGTLPANLNQEIACSSPGAKFNSPWGAPANWGMPIVLKDPACTKDCSPAFLPLGNGIPDFHLAWSQNFNFKRFGAYALLDGNFGQDVWNIGYHWSLGDFMSKDQDQAGKSVEEAKPIGYYWRRGAAPVGGNAGIGGFYDNLGPNRFSVEDASYVKLRELSVNYRVGQVAGVGDWTLGLVGRNLHTWTDFRGFDPETGIQGNNGGALNSAALTAVAGYRFPNLRTYTIQLSTAF